MLQSFALTLKTSIVSIIHFLSSMFLFSGFHCHLVVLVASILGELLKFTLRVLVWIFAVSTLRSAFDSEDLDSVTAFLVTILSSIIFLHRLFSSHLVLLISVCCFLIHFSSSYRWRLFSDIQLKRSGLPEKFPPVQIEDAFQRYTLPLPVPYDGPFPLIENVFSWCPITIYVLNVLIVNHGEI